MVVRYSTVNTGQERVTIKTKGHGNSIPNRVNVLFQSRQFFVLSLSASASDSVLRPDGASTIQAETN